MSFWETLQLHKWGTPYMWVFLCITMIYCFKGYKENERVIKLIWFQLFGLLAFYFPLTTKIMLAFFLPGYLEYERLTWLLFVAPMIALFFIDIIDKYEKKRAVIVIALLLLGIVLTDFSNTSRSFKMQENDYQLNDTAVEIADIMCDDANCIENGIIKFDDGEALHYEVLIVNSKKLKDDSNLYFLYYGIRQYAAAFGLDWVAISDDTQEAYASSNKNQDFNDIDISYYQYVIVENTKTTNTYIRNFNLNQIGKEGNYYIYKVK